MSTPFVRLLAPGDWPPDRVTQSWTATTGRRREAAVESAVDAAWAVATARPGVHLFDGPMCRLDRWHATPDRLHLDLSPTSYKSFVGTNMANPALADRFGPGVMANPVGVSPALLTADDYLLFGRRNDAVAYYPGHVHPFAGSMEPTDADVFAALRRELAEELSLTPAEITDLRCTGVAEDPALRQAELIFAATTTLTRAEVVARLDAAEHAGTWSCPATPDGIRAALATAASDHPGGRVRLTPVALAALLFFGRLRFGGSSFANASAALLTPMAG